MGNGMLRVGEAAAILNCSADHIRRLIKAGRLGAVDLSLKPGRAELRIPSDEIQRFIASRRVTVARLEKKPSKYREAVTSYL